MHFSLFFSNGLGAGDTRAIFVTAIAVLACLLGAEIAGICILLSKWRRAHHIKVDKHKYEALDERDYKGYSAAVMASFAAVPTATYTALIVLAALTAVLAVVFLVLLFVFRARGYDFASLRVVREEEEAIDVATIQRNKEDFLVLWPDAEQAEEEIAAAEAAVAESVVEETVAEERDLAVMAEVEEIAETEAVEDVNSEASVHEEAPAETAVAIVTEILPAAPTGSTVTTTTTTVENGPTFADGTKPYKVVEKVVTETVTEVYKETPAPQPQPAASSNDAVIEKLVDLLDYQIRSRREEDKEDEEKRAETAKASFATASALSDEDEDEDEDEDDAADVKNDDEDDTDVEEDDTDGDRFTGNERIIGFNPETNYYIVAHYRKSFEAKLIQAQPKIKHYYSELKNALLAYKGTKNRISWTADSFHNGRQPIAKINVKTRSLEIYLALDPASLEGTVYRGKDVGSKKKYADTPFQYKLRTPRKFKWALELVQRVCEEHGLTPIDIEHVDYEAQYPFDTTENLVSRKLIKEYIREEKPASTFELDPDHVPVVPTEDNTVLPAGDTISWEFDNERMVEREPDPIPAVEETVEEVEEVVETEPEVTPAPETPAAPQTTVTRETVKVTEVRYTERYYADAEPAYQQVITTTEPIDVTVTDLEDIKAEAEEAVESATAESGEILEDAAVEVEAIAQEADDEPVAEDLEDEIVAGDVGEVDAWDEELYEDTYEEQTEATEENFAEYDAEEALEPYVEDSAEDFEEESVEEIEEPVEEEPVEEEPAVPAQAYTDALPFRPSFYANRNYYATETVEEEELLEESEYDETSEEEGAYDTEEGYAEETYAEESYEEAYEAEEGYDEEGTYEESYEDEESYAEESDAEEVEQETPVDATISANPAIALIDLCSVESEFEAGDVISLQTLKEKQLIVDAATTLRVYATGTLSKQLTVEAHQFTLTAMAAISAAQGVALLLT